MTATHYTAGYRVSDGGTAISGFTGFGLGVIDESSHLTINKENQYNTIEQYQAFSIVTGNEPQDSIRVMAPWVDDFPLMAMYGQASGQKWADKTAYDLYFSDGFYHLTVFGCKAKSLKLTCPVGEAFYYDLDFMGLGYSTDPLTGAISPNLSGIYKQITMTIDGTGYNCDAFQYQANQDLKPLMGQSGVYQDIVDTAAVKTTFGVGFQADASIMTKYYDKDLKQVALSFIKDDATYIMSGQALMYNIMDNKKIGLPSYYTTVWIQGDAWSRQ